MVLQPCSLVPAELKEDITGRAEFVEYLTHLQLQRADLQDRIGKNKEWVVSSRIMLLVRCLVVL
jgi:hypothetical protein